MSADAIETILSIDTILTIDTYPVRLSLLGAWETSEGYLLSSISHNHCMHLLLNSMLASQTL